MAQRSAQFASHLATDSLTERNCSKFHQQMCATDTHTGCLAPWTLTNEPAPTQALRSLDNGAMPEPTPTLQHPQSVATINHRLCLFRWGVRITLAGALVSIVGSTLTQHAAGLPVTLSGTAIVVVGLILALRSLPSQAVYSQLPGALDSKGSLQCVACGGRTLSRPASAKGGLWNRPKCTCSSCGQVLFVE